MNANLTPAIPKNPRPSPSRINSDISGAAILIAGTFTAAALGILGTFNPLWAVAHNFYLWSAVKTGLIGLLLIFLAVVPAVWNAIFRNRNPYAQALAATFVGLLGVAIYAPLPIDSPASILVGAVLSAMVGLTSQKPEGSASSTSNESRVMSF